MPPAPFPLQPAASPRLSWNGNRTLQVFSPQVAKYKSCWLLGPEAWLQNCLKRKKIRNLKGSAAFFFSFTVPVGCKELKIDIPRSRTPGPKKTQVSYGTIFHSFPYYRAGSLGRASVALMPKTQPQPLDLLGPTFARALKATAQWPSQWCH